MPIELEVTWDNPASPLLQSPSIEVNPRWSGPVPGTEITRSRPKAGVERIGIPGEPSGLTLTVTFDVRLGSRTIPERTYSNDPVPREEIRQTSAPAIAATVLDVTQSFQVSEGTLVPNRDLAYGGYSHPLVTLPRRRAPGVVPIHVRTDFVDVTPLWLNRAMDSARFAKFRPRHMKLVALGCTRPQGPLIWFGVFSDKLEEKRGPIPCLVFYRPTGAYTYTDIDQNHDMLPLNRYLIRPVAKAPPAECWANDQFFALEYADTPGKPEVYRDLCVGFGRALSRKRIVLLYPWPSGADYGASASAALPDLAAQAVRVLWALGAIAQRRPCRPGRLGLAGFSAGGGQMMKALGLHASAVKEVYAFDCEGMAGFKSQLRAWMKASEENVLRMTGGLAPNIKANVELRDQLVKEDGVDPARVFVSPSNSTTAWEPGGNAWWDHALSLLERVDPKVAKQARNLGPVRHQFAMFGGEDPNREESYMMQFLRDSKL